MLLTERYRQPDVTERKYNPGSLHLKAFSEAKRRAVLKTRLDDIPEESPAEYYSQRTQGPGTIVITEGAFPKPYSTDVETAVGACAETHVKEWQQVFRRIHEQKSYVFVQLSSPGRQAEESSMARNGLVISNREAAGHKILQVGFPEQEIHQYVQEYRQAARESVLAGADGVEIHGAGGYLLGNFLDPKTNNRIDEYGGSIQNRARFILQVVDAVIDAVGASRVGIRLSPYGSMTKMTASEKTSVIRQYVYLVGQLERRASLGRRLAYIHLEEPCPAGTGSDVCCCKYTDGTISFVFSIWRGAVIRTGKMALPLENNRVPC